MCNMNDNIVPEGLRQLLCDVSREVLRAQPENIYRYIANYLEALLIAREAMNIVSDVCHDVFNMSEDHVINVKMKENVMDVMHAEIHSITQVEVDKSNEMSDTSERASNDSQESQNINVYASTKWKGIKGSFSPSTFSLAGSHMNLPKYVPYSVHDKGVIPILYEVNSEENAQQKMYRTMYDITSKENNETIEENVDGNIEHINSIPKYSRTQYSSQQMVKFALAGKGSDSDRSDDTGTP